MNLPGNQLVSAHREQVASYDPEYFDNFGVFAENILSCVKQTGAKVIFIPPFPGYPNACWTQSGHFFANFDFNLFNTEVVRLGTYFSHLASLKEAIVLTPEDFSHRDDWVSRGMISMLFTDCVHLSDKGLRAVVSATAKCVHLLKVVPSAQIPTLGDPIPAGTVFSVWVETFQELCGFESLKPFKSGKHTSSHSGQQRQLKQ